MCCLPVSMSSLQNSLWQKVENSVSYKTKQQQKACKNCNTIKACKDFDNRNYVFRRHENFILMQRVLIEQLNKKSSREVLKQRLKDKESYKKRLKKFFSFGLNQLHDMKNLFQYCYCSILFLVSAYVSNIWH